MPIKEEIIKTLRSLKPKIEAHYNIQLEGIFGSFGIGITRAFWWMEISLS